MEIPFQPQGAGGGVVTLTPDQAQTFHEFFRVGAQREVLLLDELEEQWVHHVERRKRKLCIAAAGPCPLCQVAATDRDVEPRQKEYVAPVYVRPIREPEFLQRVAVFPRAAGDEVKRLCGEMFRGRLLNVVREVSNRLKIRVAGGLPAGFPAAIPPVFPVLPFVRARFGLRQDPRLPLVFLPPIRCEQTGAAPVASRSLALTPEDAGLTPEAISKFHAYAAGIRGEKPTEVTSPPATEPAPSAPPSAPPAVPSEPAPAKVPEIIPEPSADPKPDPKPDPDVIELKRLINQGQAQYGPRKLARGGLTDSAVDEALTRRVGSIICGEVKDKSLNGNGYHGANGKGGAR